MSRLASSPTTATHGQVFTEATTRLLRVLTPTALAQADSQVVALERLADAENVDALTRDDALVATARTIAAVIALSGSKDAAAELVTRVEAAVEKWPEPESLKESFIEQVYRDRLVLSRRAQDRTLAQLEYEGEVLLYLREVASRMGSAGLLASLSAEGAYDEIRALIRTTERGRSALADL
ncbi:hypothetical protein C8Q76DRAFT_789739 [Earliella scabrosa]|nr:hypothetical protein C8Q76DRAFT_694932 [Earliella scabrosa]KAI0745336.1 hypothetical protein C8Q76DRAFT_789739 [Earliella scabrosa]